VRARLALGAVALAVAAAATIAHEKRSDSSGDGEAHPTPATYLGPSGRGHGWIPSRTTPKSVVWAVGDGADGGPDGRAVAEMVAAHRIDRFLYLGDVYETGTPSEFASNYRPLFGRFDGIAAPTIGNHEWPNVATGYVPYWTSPRGSPPPLWYGFAVSGWQLISLDSNAPVVDSSQQLGWLSRTIRDTPRYGTCRIAFMHHPRYSAGLHGDTSQLAPAFDELSGHAAIILAGHDHDMQRLRPVDGITQLVEGAGGSELYPVDKDDPRLAFQDDTDHGALRLKLTPGRAVATFVATDGSVLDRSAVPCRQG
jgi:Calcineurin-like phosphoesterase